MAYSFDKRLKDGLASLSLKIDKKKELGDEIDYILHSYTGGNIAEVAEIIKSKFAEIGLDKDEIYAVCIEMNICGYQHAG